MIWSCGWPCINLAIVDIDSGKIYNTPFVGVLGFGGCDGNMGNDGPLAYRIDSSLLVVTGSLEIGDLKTHFIHATPCKGYYYRWYGQQLKLILETLVPFGSPPPK